MVWILAGTEIEGFGPKDNGTSKGSASADLVCWGWDSVNWSSLVTDFPWECPVIQFNWGCWQKFDLISRFLDTGNLTPK